MSYSPVENLYLSALSELQFPSSVEDDVAQVEAAQGELEAEEPLQLAMGSRGYSPKRGNSGATLSDVAQGLGDMGAATAKGAVQGFGGFFGDIESIGRMVLNMVGVGVNEDTLLYTTDEIKKVLDQYAGKVGDGDNPYEKIGEFLAPGGYIKGLKEVLKRSKSLKNTKAATTGTAAGVAAPASTEDTEQ